MLDNPSEKTISERSYMKHKAKKTLSNEVTSAQKKKFNMREIFCYASIEKVEIYHVLP